MFLGDFNVEETDECLQNFLNTYSMKNIVKEPTCYKAETPRYIDLILTNRNQSVQHTTAIETGLSDFHKMIVTVLKTTFPKQDPSIINYRNYKNFDQTTFKKDLRNELGNMDASNTNYGALETAFDKVLNKHAPLKKKYVRANDAPFMTKALRKAVMLRITLRNKYNQNRIAEYWNNYRRQRNLCVKLFRTEKKRYCNNLDVTLITDNKTFWKTVKPLFSDKIKSQSKIVLVENDEAISDDRQVAEIFNNYFVTVTETLGIAENLGNIRSTEGIIDPVDIAIEKYANHPSIKAILTRFPVVAGFSFEHVSTSKLETEIKNLNSNKATTFGNIPPKILKTNLGVCAEPLQKVFNECVSNCQFPDKLKRADVSSLFKKDVSTSKTNYRPISVLPTVSKIYERLMYKQMMEHMTDYLSEMLCGFRQGYVAQHALTRFLEKCKIYLDTGGKAGAVFMDLSKAFDCVKHDLLIAKLHAYGFSHDALTFLYSYLSDRQQ